MNLFCFNSRKWYCSITTSTISSVLFSIILFILLPNRINGNERISSNVSVSMKKNKPNILLILADDVGVGDVPRYFKENKFVHMPNLENLVKNGTTFTDAHSTPLCAPSRYVLLSGNYQHRGKSFTGTWNVNYNGNQFRPRQQSIAQVLRDDGYHTAMFGKWHLGGKVPTKDGFIPIPNTFPSTKTLLKNVNHDWKKPMEQGPWDIGFDTSYITLSGIQGPPYIFLRNNTIENMNDDHYIKNNIKLWETGEYDMPHGISVINREGEGKSDWDSSAYNMILVNETKQFLDGYIQKYEHKSDGDERKPFFTYIALGSVHGPLSKPTLYLDGSPISGQHETAHLDLLSEMDKVIGSLTSMLDERNLTKDTIIIFTSDNGGSKFMKTSSVSVGHDSNSPLRGSKGTVYEGGHRVPLTIRWDNGMIPKDERRSSSFVGLNDIYATLCELVGIDISRRKGQAVDSISFADYIYNEENNSKTREYLGTWTYDKDGSSSKAVGPFSSSSIRYKNMKLIHHSKDDIYELYDLSTDLSEKRNLYQYADPQFVRMLHEKLIEMGPCYDRSGKFYVKKIRKMKSCAWFRRNNNGVRCRKYNEGWMHCGASCSRKCS